VDCNEYIERFLSAHTDGELAPDEARAAEEHLRGCERCRASLAADRELKTLIRERLAPPAAPAAIVARIHAALDGVAHPVSIGASSRGLWIWVPAALAAAVAVAIALSRGNFGLSGSVPLFDQATAKLADFQADFAPNVPSASALILHQSYEAAQMPSGVWNFTNSGFKLAGGRVDATPDGRRVTYTLFRGPANDLILCMRFKGAAAPSIPHDALMQMAGHSFYRYRGMSLSVTVGPNQRFTCILVSSIPIERFERIVAAGAVDHHF
jgi:hypothetical protein